MIDKIIFSKNKQFGLLCGKDLSFTANNQCKRFVILYGKIGSGKTTLLNCFKMSKNFFSLYKKHNDDKISKKTLDYEKNKKMIDKNCYCEFSIIAKSSSKTYYSFYPIKLNLGYLYYGSTLSQKNMKSRKEFKNFIHVNFNNYKKYNTYASIPFGNLSKKINNHWMIIYDEPIWWLHYIVMILYTNQGRKLEEKITLKLKNYTDKNINWIKSIFDKCNRYLKKVKLEILLDLQLIDYKKGGGCILLKFKKYSNQSKQITLTSTQLSSGEWQYVITTIFLIIKSDSLSNKSKIEDPIIFVDQPEDNFDPPLSTTIIENYIEIFPPSTQFFVATHSPFVIKKIIDDQPSKCLLYDFNIYKQVPIINNKTSYHQDKIIYYGNDGNWSISLYEINYLIFEIVSFEYFLELYYTLFAKLKNIYYPHKDEKIKNNAISKLNLLNKNKKQLEEGKVCLQHKEDEAHEKSRNWKKLLEVIVNDEKIVSRILQWYDKDDQNWKNFLVKFNDENWKNEEKNKKMIGELCDLLKRQLDEIFNKLNYKDEKTERYYMYTKLIEKFPNKTDIIKKIYNFRNSKCHINFKTSCRDDKKLEEYIKELRQIILSLVTN